MLSYIIIVGGQLKKKPINQFVYISDTDTVINFGNWEPFCKHLIYYYIGIINNIMFYFTLYQMLLHILASKIRAILTRLYYLGIYLKLKQHLFIVICQKSRYIIS